MTILYFCGHCGALLESGLGLLDPINANCGGCSQSVHNANNRIQGEFEDYEAEKLIRLLGQK